MRCFGTLFTAACLCFVAEAGASEAGRRPNVLLLVADDQRPDTIGALGNTSIRTPHLDHLVQRGTTFTRAVCAYPICVYSRAEILTGCTSFRAMQPYLGGKLNESLPLLPRTLQQAGYRTAYVGKWHTSGKPTTRGYDLSRGLYGPGGGKLPPTVPLDRFGKPNTGYTGWVFQDDDGTKHSERGVGLTPNISEPFADAAIALIDAGDSRPFFIHVNFTAPHDPRFIPKGFETAAARRPPLPGNFAPDHPFDHGNQGGRDEVLLPRPLEPDVVRDELGIYYALVEHLDAQVGRIVAELERTGKLADTIIIYTADHGLALGSHGLTGKQNMYEHSINVPLVMAGPGIPADIRRAGQCYLRDLFPTLCEWCGAKTPDGLDGRSLNPLITGELAEIHPFVVGYFTDTQRMIREGKWKYARYPKAGREQLFDLQRDPDELHDLSADSGLASRMAELRGRLDQWLIAHGDPLMAKP